MPQTQRIAQADVFGEQRRQYGRYKLNKDQNTDLIDVWVRYRDNGQPHHPTALRALQSLINGNTGLVIAEAQKHIGKGLELNVMVQEGTLGLHRALEKFEPSRGFQLSTYAHWWIKQGITRAIANSSRTVRLPVRVTELLNKAKRAARELSQELQRTPSRKEIADRLGVTVAKLERAINYNRDPVSCDASTKTSKNEAVGASFMDIIPNGDDNEYDRLYISESVEKMMEVIASLKEKDRIIITKAFGLDYSEPMTAKQIAAELGFSPAHINGRIKQTKMAIAKRLGTEYIPENSTEIDAEKAKRSIIALLRSNEDMNVLRLKNALPYGMKDLQRLMAELVREGVCERKEDTEDIFGRSHPSKEERIKWRLIK